MKTVYCNEAAYLGYEVKNGCLQIESEVHGEHESEKHYLFSVEDSEKIFTLMTQAQFEDLCKTKNVKGLEAFLEENDIHPKTFTI